MKIRIENYTFDASAGTITFTDYANIALEGILIIQNVTVSELIYIFNDSGYNGTVLTNVFTSALDLSAMNDTDKLLIYYDDSAATMTINGTVTATVDTSGLATSAKQDTIDTSINTLLKPADTLTKVSTVDTITNVVHIDDNSSTISIDGTITANLSATDNAVLDDIAANQTDASQKTQIVDGSGNVIGATSNALDVNIKSGASAGEQYKDGDAVNGDYKGTIALGTDGSNYQALSVDASGNMNVNIVSGAGSGGTAADDDADFTAGSTAGTPAMGVYESSPTSVTDGDLGIVGITAGRRLKTSATIDSALPAGTNAIGKLSANSGVDIGDVDVTSLPVGHNIIDSGTVTAVTSITNVVHVDDNAGSLTVDGTVTANLSATDNAVLDNIQTSVDAINAKLVSGTDIGDVDVKSVVPGYGATNLGKRTGDAYAGSHTGVMAMAVDASSGNYVPLLRSTYSGALIVTEEQLNLAHGVKTVTTAGSDVALASSTGCKRVIIQAQTDNTSLIAVGGNGVDATIATGTGVLLYPGDTMDIQTNNLANIYIDALVNGEGVRYTYFT